MANPGQFYDLGSLWGIERAGLRPSENECSGDPSVDEALASEAQLSEDRRYVLLDCLHR